MKNRNKSLKRRIDTLEAALRKIVENDKSHEVVVADVKNGLSANFVRACGNIARKALEAEEE